MPQNTPSSTDAEQEPRRSSPYEQAQPPKDDPAREQFIENTHNALVTQTVKLVTQLEREGGEQNAIRDLSLSVLALSNVLLYEERA